MSATINTFPPFQSMNSPRGWILAVIVLLHLGFFWLLSTSMGQQLIQKWQPPSVMVEVQRRPPVEPQPQPRQFKPEKLDQWRIFVPRPDDPTYAPDDTKDVIRDEPRGDGGTSTADPSEPKPVAVIAVPEIDPRIGLSEPAYPASEVRQEHTGTVLLSVYVLANGRVGDVRLDQTSGWPKLDDSALREARRWRFKPGMQNGVAAPMWKQVPITFQLQGRSR
jgi:periplasmic protein TonB